MSVPVARGADPVGRSRVAGRRNSIVINALPVTFSSDRVVAWIRPFDPSEDLSALRRNPGGDLDSRRRGDRLFVFRLHDQAPEPRGVETEIEIGTDLALVAGLLPGALATRLPRYKPLRYRPFRFRALKRNLMTEAMERTGLHSTALANFVVSPRYELDGRVVEVTDGDPRVVITVDLSTDWRIDATLGDLAMQGFALAGHYAVWIEERRDGGHLAGRIVSIAGDRAIVEIGDGEQVDIASAEISLEPSRRAVVSIVEAALGPSARVLLNAVDEQVGELLGGPSLLEQLKYVRRILGQEPLSITNGLSCQVEDPIHLARHDEAVALGRPVRYCFDAARTKQDDYAWRGLEQYGPFSGDTFAKRTPTILVVHPAGSKGQVETFVQALRDGIQGPNLRAYVKGFARTFGLTNPRFTFAPVALSSESPAEAYRRTVDDALAGATTTPDAALVVIRDDDAALPDGQNPYLFAKASLLMGGVPVQEIRLSTATREPASLQYVLQNVSVALYAKMNGIPWTVDHDLTIADEIVIGIGTAELTESRFTPRQRFVGVTTVFRGDGNYLLGHLSRECTYAEYPEVLRQSATEVLTEIKTRNAWQTGDVVRVVVHSSRSPRDIDAAAIISDVLDAVGGDQEVEFAFVQVSHDHPFVLFDEGERGYGSGTRRKGIMAPGRGLIVQTSSRSRLLCTMGPQLVKRAGQALPRPLQIHLHRASTFTDTVYLTEQVLKFTSLTWRSTMPAPEPVSIYYSELIARLLARLRHVPGWSPATLRSRLRSSRWFL